MQSGPPALLCAVVALICLGSNNVESADVPTVYTKDGESVTVECKFSVSYTYYMMYWYRQPSSGEMIYVINIYSQSKHARAGRYSVEFYKPNQMLKLTISALRLSDSAVYFCAVSEFHGEGSDRKRLTKTPRAQPETATCSRRRQPAEPTGTMGGSAGSRERLMNVLKTIFPHLVSKKEPRLRDPSLQSIFISVSGV